MWSEIAKRNDGLLKKINFWVFGVMAKIIPCVMLTYLSLALIRVMVEADKRKTRLKESSRIPIPQVRPEQQQENTKHQLNVQRNNERKTESTIKFSVKTNSIINTKVSRNSKKVSSNIHSSPSSTANDRTTRMLIAILLLFLITEFPSGILALLSGIIGDKFFEKVRLK